MAVAAEAADRVQRTHKPLLQLFRGWPLAERNPRARQADEALAAAARATVPHPETGEPVLIGIHRAQLWSHLCSVLRLQSGGIYISHTLGRTLTVFCLLIRYLYAPGGGS